MLLTHRHALKILHAPNGIMIPINRHYCFRGVESNSHFWDDCLGLSGSIVCCLCHTFIAGFLRLYDHAYLIFTWKIIGNQHTSKDTLQISVRKNSNTTNTCVACTDPFPMSNGQEEICRKPSWGCHESCYKCSVQSVPCRVPILLGPPPPGEVSVLQRIRIVPQTALRKPMAVELKPWNMGPQQKS